MIFTFKSKFQGFGSPEVTVEFECDQLSDVVVYFEQFLRGAGYVFDGNLDFVDDEQQFEEFMEDEEEPQLDEPFESIYDGDLNSPSAAATQSWQSPWQGTAPSVAMQWTVKELMKNKGNDAN